LEQVSDRLDKPDYPVGIRAELLRRLNHPDEAADAAERAFLTRARGVIGVRQPETGR
jgi:predicted RNA polymerase sigma factor